MDPKAMRFLNLLGNRFFGLLLSVLIGQAIKDTLCGTKVLWRVDYAHLAAGRAHFGEFDPFGDFDLIFGAAKLNLRIVEIPVCYEHEFAPDLEEVARQLKVVAVCFRPSLRYPNKHRLPRANPITSTNS